jgi:hypothetical protein
MAIEAGPDFGNGMPFKLSELAGKLLALFAFELVGKATGERGNFIANHCNFMERVTHCCGYEFPD